MLDDLSLFPANVLNLEKAYVQFSNNIYLYSVKFMFKRTETDPKWFRFHRQCLLNTSTTIHCFHIYFSTKYFLTSIDLKLSVKYNL